MILPGMLLNLRSKFLLIIISFLVLQGAIFFAYYSMILMPNVESLEITQAEKNAQRSRNMLNMDMKDLDALSSHWAKQNVLVNLFKDNNTAQIQTLFSEENLREDKLHLFYLLDAQKKVLAELTLDPQTQKPYPTVNFVEKLSKLKPNFFKEVDLSKTLSGIFISSRGPMLISVKPMSSEKGNDLGWLIMGRFITKNMLDKFAHQMRIDLEMFPLGVKDLSEKIQKLIPVIQANPRLVHTESTAASLKAYTHLNDISGQPKVVLLSITPRFTSMLVKESMKESYGVLLAANFLLVLLLLKILQHAIVNPTSKITRFIKNATKNVEAPPRIKTTRDDEFGQLTKSLNELITQFCEYRNKSMSKAYKEGGEKLKHEIIEDLMHAYQMMLPMIDNLEKRLWNLSLNALEKLHAEVEYSKPEDLDWDQFKMTLANNNYYLNNEIQDHRNLVRKLKQRMLRTATILKSYLVHINNGKIFSSYENENSSVKVYKPDD